MLFKHLFTPIVAKPSHCGKTTFCIKLIENLQRLCTQPKFNQIVWCFSEVCAVPHLPNITPTELFQTSWRIGTNTHSLHWTIYCTRVRTGTYVIPFPRGAITATLLFSVTQNLFHQSQFGRDVSLNAICIVIFKAVRDESQFPYLARHLPRGKPRLVRSISRRDAETPRLFAP